MQKNLNKAPQKCHQVPPHHIPGRLHFFVCF
jgi:hypothetical protein